MDYRKLLLQVLIWTDQAIDKTWKKWRHLAGPMEMAQLVPYRSYGTRDLLTVRGRVLTNRPLRPSQTDTQWRNAVHMLQRWASREVEGVTVVATWNGGDFWEKTDAEGYFRIEIPTLGALDPSSPWHEVGLRLPDLPKAPATTTKVLVPVAGAQFGVVSDIDDTIIFSSATNYVRMARIVLFGSAFSRLPFKGVAAFYRGLEKGTVGRPANPFFYVSSGPWNLYDVLRDLFEFRHIPAGPLLLQDFGVDADKLLHMSHHEHKLGSIRDIFDRYPDLRFLLIGDSGQADPEIYREVVRLYPERVLGIYIRNVTTSTKRHEAIRQLAAETEAANCTLLLVGETEGAAEHALERGWIAPEVLEEIRTEKTSEKPAWMVEEALGQQT